MAARVTIMGCRPHRAMKKPFITPEAAPITSAASTAHRADQGLSGMD